LRLVEVSRIGDDVKLRYRPSVATGG